MSNEFTERNPLLKAFFIIYPKGLDSPVLGSLIKDSIRSYGNPIQIEKDLQDPNSETYKLFVTRLSYELLEIANQANLGLEFLRGKQQREIFLRRLFSKQLKNHYNHVAFNANPAENMKGSKLLKEQDAYYAKLFSILYEQYWQKIHQDARHHKTFHDLIKREIIPNIKDPILRHQVEGLLNDFQKKSTLLSKEAEAGFIDPDTKSIDLGKMMKNHYEHQRLRHEFELKVVQTLKTLPELANKVIAASRAMDKEDHDLQEKHDSLRDQFFKNEATALPNIILELKEMNARDSIFSESEIMLLTDILNHKKSVAPEEILVSINEKIEKLPHSDFFESIKKNLQPIIFEKILDAKSKAELVIEMIEHDNIPRPLDLKVTQDFSPGINDPINDNRLINNLGDGLADEEKFNLICDKLVDDPNIPITLKSIITKYNVNGSWDDIDETEMLLNSMKNTKATYPQEIEEIFKQGIKILENHLDDFQSNQKLSP